MFADRKATAMIPAHDLDRALRWYEQKLGIAGERMEDYGARLRLNGVDAFLYVTAYAGSAGHTLLSFDTDDLAGDMARLRERGVAFLDYDLPGIKTVDGLATFGPVKNAWCKDSEGNIIGFVEGM